MKAKNTKKINTLKVHDTKQLKVLAESKHEISVLHKAKLGSLDEEALYFFTISVTRNATK
jgi:hypothetical protein